MKNAIVLLSILFFTGCGCKHETVRYPLNSYEKNIIPYNESQLLEYKDENYKTNLSTAFKKEVLEIDLNSSDDEGCLSNIIESQSFELSFNNSNKKFHVNIEKSYNNKTKFEIYEVNPLEQNTFALYGIEGLNTQNLEQVLTNFSIDGFQYNNVFVFEVKSSSIESEFETIVFSPQEGIVFLKKRAGGFLRLN